MKKIKFILLITVVCAFIISYSGRAAAVNEGFNPRLMHEANKIIASYEAQIVQNGPSVEAYEWIIKGLEMRRTAYFTKDASEGFDEKIAEKHRKILEIEPLNYNSICGLISSGMSGGNIDDDLFKLGELVKSVPQRYEARLLSGKLLFYKADFDGAIMEITKAIALMPAGSTEEAAYYKNLLSAANKFSASMRRIAPAAKGAITEDAGAEPLYEQALIYLDDEMIKYSANIDKGIELLKKAVEKDSSYCEAYIKLGEALGSLKGDYKEAMKMLAKVDNITKEKSVLKKARLLRQKFYRLNMSKGRLKKK